MVNLMCENCNKHVAIYYHYSLNLCRNFHLCSNCIPKDEHLTTLSSDVLNIQKEVFEWQVKNFGECTKEDQFLGMVEELGEVAHSLLKLKQKIRMNENHEENLIDAIGDLSIFIINFCSVNNLNFYQVLLDTWSTVSQRDFKRNPVDGK